MPCVLTALLTGVLATTPTPAQARGRLAVMVVVDQMRGDEVSAFEGAWSEGWQTLLQEGEVHTQVLHGHGLTETASGHATLGTAALPSRHGVLDKTLFDSDRQALRGLCDFVTASDASAVPRCDAGALLMPSLGERLKAKSPNSRVVAVAAKARSANLLAGQAVDWVLWSDVKKLLSTDKTPSASGSRIALDEAAGADLWVGLEGRSHDRRATPVWARRVADSHASEGRWDEPHATGAWGGRPPNDHWVSGKCGFGTHFPHVFGVDDVSAAQPNAASWDVGWSCSPDSDRWTMDLALESLGAMQMGAQGTTDLLLISLSATDYVGHAFGFESQERAAILHAVDLQLGRLLRGIKTYREGLPPDQQFDVELVVTADHGVNPRLDTARAHGFPAAALAPEVGHRAIARALLPWGPDAPRTILRPPFVWLLEPEPERRAKMAMSIAHALEEVPGVRQAWSQDALATASGEHARLMRASWSPERGGDVIMTFERFAKPIGSADDIPGAWHGGPYAHERHVPWAYWGDFHAAQVHSESKTVVDALTDFVKFLGL